MTKQEAEPVLLSKDQAARRLGISIRTIEKLILKRELNSVQIGRRRLIRVQDVDALIKRQLSFQVQ